MYYQKLDFGITVIDCLFHRPGLAACYLVEQSGSFALIDCGTKNSVPHILEVLDSLSVAVEQLAYIIPTHVHLDHAGGAGELMTYLPNAKLLVHPRGLRHMCDPGKLQAGATAVYGEVEFNRTFGGLTPVPEARARAVDDGEEIDLNGRKLKFIHSPGHAKHHFCIYDAASQGIFTGDTFGLSYREFDDENGKFILPTSTPVQFAPQAWLQTLDRLMSLNPQRMYLTHFGMVEDVVLLSQQLRQSIEEYVQIAQQCKTAENRVEKLQQMLLQHTMDKLKALGKQHTEAEVHSLLDMDIQLNAQGLDFWLSSQG